MRLLLFVAVLHVAPLASSAWTSTTHTAGFRDSSRSDIRSSIRSGANTRIWTRTRTRTQTSHRNPMATLKRPTAMNRSAAQLQHSESEECSSHDYHDHNANHDHNDHPIVILGGGFAGLNTALTLDSLWNDNDNGNGNGNGNGNENEQQQMPRPKIILVDDKERFVFLPLLYELCVGDAEVS